MDCFFLNLGTVTQFLFSIFFVTFYFERSSSSLFERAPIPGQIQTELSSGFILLLSQTAVLAGSDVGSDVVKPASSFGYIKPLDLVLHIVPY